MTEWTTRFAGFAIAIVLLAVTTNAADAQNYSYVENCAGQNNFDTAYSYQQLNQFNYANQYQAHSGIQQGAFYDSGQVVRMQTNSYQQWTPVQSSAPLTTLGPAMYSGTPVSNFASPVMNMAAPVMNYGSPAFNYSAPVSYSPNCWGGS